MMRKKVLALTLAGVLAAAGLAGCGGGSTPETTGETAAQEAESGVTAAEAPADETAAETPAGEAASPAADDEAASSGTVYLMNFKPEDAETYENLIMPTFTEETGIAAEVLTAAANTYGSTLKAEMAKENMPTIFQMADKSAMETWKDYALDLKDTEFYNRLSDKSLALTDGESDKIYAVPYTIEGFGIIANKKIVAEYCATEGAKVGSIEEINNFDTLKAVAEDMQAKKDELGIQGAFASTSFSPGEEWRWTTHLANLPLYYDLNAQGVEDGDTLTGDYLDNFKQIFDLYINNSCTEPTMLSSKTVADAMAEFALGDVVFTQNGNWGWNDIKENNPDMSAEDITFLPIYIGVEGEESQGLCVGTEANWAVNQKASAEDQEASLKFLDWLFTSETGKQLCKDELGYICPFDTFSTEDTPDNPLAQSISEWSKTDVTAVPWSFNYMPSQKFKDDLGAGLLEYAQGTGEWPTVEAAFVDGWATERANPSAEE